MSKMTWFEAICKVLSDSDKPMRQRDIAKEIVRREMVNNTDGASGKVGAVISQNVNSASTKIIKVKRGVYCIKKEVLLQDKINSTYLGQSIMGKGYYNCCSQDLECPNSIGCYILYDYDGRPFYVGRSLNLKERLLQHKANISSNRFYNKWAFAKWIALSTSDHSIFLEAALIALHNPTENKKQVESFIFN